MQPYVSNSVKTALNRTIGTVIGGVAGALFLLAERATGMAPMTLLQYFWVSLCIIPLIYITVVIQKTTASYITCVVFLSITISHGMDVNPYLFALNRMADTLIGIFISLGVNAFRLPRRKNTSLLFVCGLEEGLTPGGRPLSSTLRIRLNHLIGRGALIAPVSSRTPAAFLPAVEGVDFPLPAVVLDGAALYDIRSKTYLYVKTLSVEDVEAVEGVFEGFGLNCFLYAVIHNVMHVYYGAFTNPVEEEMVHTLRGNPHKNYVCGPLPAGHLPSRIMAVDTVRMAGRLLDALQALPCSSRLRLVSTPCPGKEGYVCIYIYPAGATREAAVAELKRRSGACQVVAFGGSRADIPMLETADISYAAGDAAAAVRQAAGHSLLPMGGRKGKEDHVEEAIVKTIDRLFARGIKDAAAGMSAKE